MTIETSENDHQAIAEPAELLAHVLFSFGLSSTQEEILESIQASAHHSPCERISDGAKSLGLEGHTTPLPFAKITPADLPCIIEHRDDGRLALLQDISGSQFHILSPGNSQVEKISHKEFSSRFSKNVTRFSLPDQDQRSPQSRLRSLNPFRSLGMSRVTWVLTAALFSNILGLATSLFVMVVYDRVLPNRAVESLYALAIGVAIAVLFDSLLKSARSKLIENSTKIADVRMTEDLFDQYVAVANLKNRKSVGELASIMRDYENWREFMTTAMILTFVDLPFVLLFIWVIWLISSWLFLVCAIAIPVVLLLVLGVQPLIARSSREASNSAQTRHGLLIEVLGGLEALRVTGAYALMKNRFLSQARIHAQAIGRSKEWHQLVGNIISTVQQAVQVGVIVLGFHLFVNQSITMGAIIAAVILSGRAMGPIARLGQTLGRANTALVARENLVSFLKIERKDLQRTHRMPGPNTKVPAIEISNATLRLTEGSTALFSGLNLKIHKGERVALLGKTGSGKTSLIRLINGLITPETGSVLIDGISIEAIPRAHVHQRIGTVFQQPWLFSGTLRDNVSLGNSSLDESQLEKALQMSGLNSPKGDGLALNMPISDQGANLSGGQRQAVSLARAFAFNPDIYLLDEPSSAMDAQFEGRLVEQITGVLSDRTFVIATHKAQILQLCTRVIVMERGQIVKDMPAQEYRDSMLRNRPERSAPKGKKISTRLIPKKRQKEAE